MTDEFFDRSEFVQYFRDETDELLHAIEADLLRLEQFVDAGGADPEIVNSLFRALHTIKGSAGMLQFSAVQQLAHKLENVFDLLRKDRMPLTESGVNLLFEGRDILSALVQAAVGGGDEPDGVDEYVARLDGAAGVYEETAQAIEGPRASNDADDELAPIDDALVSAFEAEVARLLEQAQHAERIVDEFLTPAPAGAAPKADRAAAPAPATANGAVNVAAKPQKNATIRVDIERLDLLLNLVGELVINRTRISDIASTLGRELGERDKAGASLTSLAKDLTESSALLARTTNEIQESIMKVRMVPIGQVFDRFPRTVRDLAKARGKEIQLEISGADTDLDKTIVDEVGEPLMHLIRNCVDHGIEPPDVRVARGKPRHGTIALNAYHEGNQIIIEISDDGGGIDLARVRDKAIRTGIITEADRLTDRETMELIFSPGFSTAENVTDVSGRGVGMDVVKKNILRLKGVFDVDSVPGSGTTFTMKLPLTLAIIQALLVRVANELYSIPLDAVIESQRIRRVRRAHGARRRGHHAARARRAARAHRRVLPARRATRSRQGDDRHRRPPGPSGRARRRLVPGRAGDRHQAALRRDRTHPGHLGRDDPRQRFHLAHHRRPLADRRRRRGQVRSCRILGSVATCPTRSKSFRSSSARRSTASTSTRCRRSTAWSP